MECSHGFVVISKVHCCFHSTSKSTARHSIGNVFWDTLGHGPWLGIRGTQVKSSIQDIVDEVAPIKKAPYELRADSFECDVTRLIRGL